MEGNDVFEKHTPVYPLPEGILKMSKDETICQFCGVSYLIHTEIKRLEDRIQELEKMRTEYEVLKLKEKQFKQISDEQNERISNLEDKLATRIQMMSSLSVDIESKEVEIGRLKLRLQESEDQNSSLSANNARFKEKMLAYESVVKETALQVARFKSEVRALDECARDERKLMQQYFANLATQVTMFESRQSREWIEKIDELNELKLTVASLTKKASDANDELAVYRRQAESSQSANNDMREQLATLRDEVSRNETLRSRYTQLEREKSSLLKTHSNCSAEIDQLRRNLITSEREIDELKKNLNSCQDVMDASKRAGESEMRMQADELRRARLELDSLKKQYTQKDMFEKEILGNHQKTLDELKKLNGDVGRLNNEIELLRSEKSSLAVAHQCQITQLKDSFMERLRESDDWPLKLQQELTRERDKHRHELNALETNLRDNFRIEKEIQQQRYDEMLVKCEQLSREVAGSSRHRIDELERDKAAALSELDTLRDEKASTERRLRQELDMLREVTKQLHERLEKYVDEGGDEMVGSRKLRDEVRAKEAALADAESRVKNGDAQLDRMRDEVRVLQETVHNECMERQELLEKLEEAREELLALKKNAYSSQLIPLKNSVTGGTTGNKPPPATTTTTLFKHQQQPLIDINERPDRVRNSTSSSSVNYPRNMNELFNQQKQQQQQQQQSLINRRNSMSGVGAVAAVESNASSTRPVSDKSQAESSAKLVVAESGVFNTERVFNSYMQMTNNMTNGGGGGSGGAGEPVQLFRKLNELNNSKRLVGSNNNSNAHKSSSVAAETKKRISLLLARRP